MRRKGKEEEGEKRERELLRVGSSPGRKAVMTMESERQGHSVRSHINGKRVRDGHKGSYSECWNCGLDCPPF